MPDTQKPDPRDLLLNILSGADPTGGFLVGKLVGKPQNENMAVQFLSSLIAPSSLPGTPVAKAGVRGAVRHLDFPNVPTRSNPLPAVRRGPADWQIRTANKAVAHDIMDRILQRGAYSPASAAEKFSDHAVVAIDKLGRVLGTSAGTAGRTATPQDFIAGWYLSFGSLAASEAKRILQERGEFIPEEIRQELQRIQTLEVPSLIQTGRDLMGSGGAQQ